MCRDEIPKKEDKKSDGNFVTSLQQKYSIFVNHCIVNNIRRLSLAFHLLRVPKSIGFWVQYL